MSQTAPAVAAFRADAMRVNVFATRADAGRAAADYVETAMRRLILTGGAVRMIFAAAPSQNEFLADLVARPQIDWGSVSAWHMDEYLGLEPAHPSSFRAYLHQHLFKHVPIPREQIHAIPGECVESPLKVCLDYERSLRAAPPEIVCGGIGGNGHLAFNDPPVADFADPVWMKVVRLDSACRAQQVADGCFARLEDVPTHAYTMTIPALMSAAVVSVVVPGARKAQAVHDALRGQIDETCPASILRQHTGAALFLDMESAALVI